MRIVVVAYQLALGFFALFAAWIYWKSMGGGLFWEIISAAMAGAGCVALAMAIKTATE